MTLKQVILQRVIQATCAQSVDNANNTKSHCSFCHAELPVEKSPVKEGMMVFVGNFCPFCASTFVLKENAVVGRLSVRNSKWNTAQLPN